VLPRTTLLPQFVSLMRHGGNERTGDDRGAGREDDRPTRRPAA